MSIVFCHSVRKPGEKNIESQLDKTLYSQISFLILQINSGVHGKPKRYKKVTLLLVIKRWGSRTWAEGDAQNKKGRFGGKIQNFEV